MAQYRSLPGREGEPRRIRRKMAIAWARRQMKQQRAPKGERTAEPKL